MCVAACLRAQSRGSLVADSQGRSSATATVMTTATSSLLMPEWEEAQQPRLVGCRLWARQRFPWLPASCCTAPPCRCLKLPLAALLSFLPLRCVLGRRCQRRQRPAVADLAQPSQERQLRLAAAHYQTPHDCPGQRRHGRPVSRATHSEAYYCLLRPECECNQARATRQRVGSLPEIRDCGRPLAGSQAQARLSSTRSVQ